jgi:hypothetical protein
MAICTILEDAGRTEEQYDLISAHVRGSGPVPPEGCRVGILSRERAVTVWDSPEARERFFAERLAPAYQAVGHSLDEVARTQFEVDTLFAGDLLGRVAEPAGSER